MDIIHRILSGNIRGGSPYTNRGELVAAGLFVFVWFAIDVIQFGDRIWDKFNPAQSALCLLIGTPMLDKTPGFQISPALPLTQNNGAR